MPHANADAKMDPALVPAKTVISLSNSGRFSKMRFKIVHCNNKRAPPPSNARTKYRIVTTLKRRKNYPFTNKQRRNGDILANSGIEKMASEKMHDPKVFGPVFWKTYEIIVETYPHNPNKREKEAAKMFFRSQKYLIPCATCAANYRKIYKTYPPQVDSRDDLKNWLQLLKEKVAVEKAKRK
jgi:hypothetical protein